MAPLAKIFNVAQRSSNFDLLVMRSLETELDGSFRSDGRCKGVEEESCLPMRFHVECVLG